MLVEAPIERKASTGGVYASLGCCLFYRRNHRGNFRLWGYCRGRHGSGENPVLCVLDPVPDLPDQRTKLPTPRLTISSAVRLFYIALSILPMPSRLSARFPGRRPRHRSNYIFQGDICVPSQHPIPLQMLATLTIQREWPGL